MNITLWKFDDGGRSAAGYRGTARDCVVRAIAIATEQPYQEVYDMLFRMNKTSRRTGGKNSPRDAGTHRKTIHEYLSSLGWQWHPTMGIGTGCKVHLLCTPDKSELPMGRLIVSLSRHLVAVIDRVIHDTYDCSRDGTRCIYGFWTHN